MSNQDLKIGTKIADFKNFFSRRRTNLTEKYFFITSTTEILEQVWYIAIAEYLSKFVCTSGKKKYIMVLRKLLNT